MSVDETVTEGEELGGLDVDPDELETVMEGGGGGGGGVGGFRLTDRLLSSEPHKELDEMREGEEVLPLRGWDTTKLYLKRFWGKFTGAGGTALEDLINAIISAFVNFFGDGEDPESEPASEPGDSVTVGTEGE